MIPGISGLWLVKVLVQIAAYALIAWVYARRLGHEDALKQLVRDILPAPIPGGGR